MIPLTPYQEALERISTLEKQVKYLKDEINNPDLDDTECAHPAYWRGQDNAVAAMCKRINQILDGADVPGVSNEPWHSTKRRIQELRMLVEQGQQIVDEQEVAAARAAYLLMTMFGLSYEDVTRLTNMS